MSFFFLPQMSDWLVVKYFYNTVIFLLTAFIKPDLGGFVSFFWKYFTGRHTHPDRFEEVQVGQEVALRLVQPVAWRLADDLLSQMGNVAVGDVNKLLQGRGVAEVSEMEAEAFRQHLDGQNREDAVLEGVEKWPKSKVFCQNMSSDWFRQWCFFFCLFFLSIKISPQCKSNVLACVELFNHTMSFFGCFGRRVFAKVGHS